MDLEAVNEIKRHVSVVADGSREELKHHVGVVAEGLRSEVHETRDEMKRHFGVVLEELQSKIEAVAEGQQARFERVDRQLADMRNEFRDEIQQTRTTIHLSYGEVDRRLKDLEAGR